MENINIKQETPHFVDIDQADNQVIESPSDESDETNHQKHLNLQKQLDIEAKKNAELSLELETMKQKENEQKKYFENLVNQNIDKAQNWKRKLETAT